MSEIVPRGSVAVLGYQLLLHYAPGKRDRIGERKQVRDMLALQVCDYFLRGLILLKRHQKFEIGTEVNSGTSGRGAIRRAILRGAQS